MAIRQTRLTTENVSTEPTTSVTLTPAEKRELATIVRDTTFNVGTLPDFDVYCAVGADITETITRVAGA